MPASRPAGKGRDSLKSYLLCPWAAQDSIMGWLLVDNDVLSPEQPPEEADWTEREKRRRGEKRGKKPGSAEFVFRSVKRRWQDSFTQFK